MIPCARLCMKPVLLSLCLILLFMAGTASASVEDCPTCSFLNDVSDLITNPYSGCPTCIFSYNANGTLADTNAYSGCPTCIYAYDANGSLIINAHTGCTSCRVSSGMTTNTLGSCPSCTISSGVSTAAITYTFSNGTPIPEDYVCPIHGIYCPDDPRPLELRPGYVAPIPTVKPTLRPHIQPQTSAEFISLFKRPTILPFSDRWKSILNR